MLKLFQMHPVSMILGYRLLIFIEEFNLVFEVLILLTLFNKAVCKWMKMKLYLISQFHIILITFH